MCSLFNLLGGYTPQQGSEVRVPMIQTLLPHMGKSGYRGDLWLPWVPYYGGGLIFFTFTKLYYKCAKRRDM
jgi:hypothetical protein